MNHPTIICAIGILTGLWQLTATQPTQKITVQPPIWSKEFDGLLLVPLPMTDVEKNFQRGFPGSIATFRCGKKNIILRHITRASRKLHPSTHCLRAAGYRIGKTHTLTDPSGRRWTTCKVEKSGITYLLQERITDPHGNEWLNPSSWYWHALAHPNSGPWLAQTIITPP